MPTKSQQHREGKPLLAEQSLTVTKGRVAQYDKSTGFGVIELETASEVDFRSTDFRGGRPPRFPVEGEDVIVVLSPTGVAVTVRAASD
jgi:hypothetical protein